MAAKIWKMVWNFGYKGNGKNKKGYYKENLVIYKTYFCNYLTKNANLINKYVKNLKEYYSCVTIRL